MPEFRVEEFSLLGVQCSPGSRTGVKSTDKIVDFLRGLVKLHLQTRWLEIVILYSGTHKTVQKDDDIQTN